MVVGEEKLKIQTKKLIVHVGWKLESQRAPKSAKKVYYHVVSQFKTRVKTKKNVQII